MSPEAQRIAIAESVGWKHHKGEEPVYGGTFKEAGWTSPKGRFHKSDWASKSVFGLPDYLRDLNAMHEAEKALEPSIIKAYVSWIWQVMATSNEALIGTIHATATQRAEAYLRTIGKWEET